MLEKELNKQILITDEGFNTALDKQELDNIGQVPTDWFILGDAAGLTIHNNTIPTEVIHKIIALNLKEMNLTSIEKKDIIKIEPNKIQKPKKENFQIQ